ncbi:sushi domain-containing protein 3 [Lampris incognitus]|uniref:sushi domain-containing protein 3 n=1 Tax=Lampris incognitus TaxID=2546036 RepID=UPI0024B52042|nr:sushi domain-containing protein 3 [Lampris incognitus]
MSTSRAGFTNENASPARNVSGFYQGQCTPMPLPALGTQRVTQGNGTNVGTVISRQCPAKYRLVGGDLRCVVITNIPQWVGEPYCEPLSMFEDVGFRVAVLVSIVSSAVILLLSVAFVTCCVSDCKKKERRRKNESDADLWQTVEQIERMEGRSHYGHKGRNTNNNNNTNTNQDPALSLWDDHDPALCNSKRSCRCCEHHHGGLTVPPACSYGSVPLPGCTYDQSLLHQNSRLDQNCCKLLNSVPLQSIATPQHLGPPWSSSQAQGPGPVQTGAEGPNTDLVWQYLGQQEVSVSALNPTATQESYRVNMNTTKESCIQTIFV